MNVMGLRLNPEERKHILQWAKQQKKDKSQAAWELLAYGWRFALMVLCFLILGDGVMVARQILDLSV